MGTEVSEMKKMMVLVVVAAFALGGCATGSFLGLATSQYVNDTAKSLTDQQAAAAAEIAQLKSQLADVQAMKDQTQAALNQAQAAVDQVNQTQKVIQELQGIAKAAEARIGSIPREVIQQIVDILQTALKQ